MAAAIRVLFVDDESSVLDLAKIFTEQSGDFTITTVPNATEAIRLLLQERFDAIISDYQIPAMDGIEFLKAIRARGDKTPFIIFTGKGREEVVIEALNAGVDGYFQKGGNPKSQFAEISRKIKKAIESRQVEKALQESEAKFRSVIESIPDVIWTIASDGRTVFISPRVEKVYGFTPEEIYRGSDTIWLGRIHPDDVKNVKEQLNALFERKNLFDIEYRIQRKDQSWIWLHNQALAIYEKDGIWYADGIFGDVTERKRVEDALIAANKKLKLLSSITRHDILNQLTGLQGYFTILKKKQIDPTLNEYLEKAISVAKRISAVIRFTKEYENLGVNTPVWQDCRTLVDTVAQQVQLGQIIVKNDLSTGTEVFADRLFDRVFYNLFDNSLRYGGNQMKMIRISSQKSDANLIILYENDGVGISAGDKEHLFSHGFGKHTGHGLFLSQEILSITGITIAENGIPEKGIRFEITVPNGMWRTAGNVT